MPEKARLLEKLKAAHFNVPDFMYVSASDFREERFGPLEAFLENHRESFKVIARSAHPQEERFKGGTFDSLETYADLAGIKYARDRIIELARTGSRLSIKRQQRFNKAPEIDLNEMGVIVMPFIEGTSVMAKMVGEHWEFGYSRNRIHKVDCEPYITKTPHDTRLMDISQSIQDLLGFQSEIEYITSPDGEIRVVQAKDISRVEILETMESKITVTLDGIRRIRKRRNYRERPLFVMDNRQFYINIISRCEEMVLPNESMKPDIDDILRTITEYEEELESFALQHERFAVLGLHLRPPSDLYQIANHYLDDTPELQKVLSQALHDLMYKIDYFLSEADTLIVKDKIGVNLCTHDAYGIDTVRYPYWFVYWNVDRHDQVVREFSRLGFKTGDSIGIDVGYEERPRLFRL